MEEYCRSGHATDDNLAHAHLHAGNSMYYLLLFHCSSGCTKRASVLHYTCIACLVLSSKSNMSMKMGMGHCFKDSPPTLQ